MRNPMRPPGDDLAVRFAEIERRLRALETSQPGGFSGDGTKTFLRSGRDLEVTGGDIIIDGGQLVAGPTTVDASGVDVGPTTLNSSGVSVGPTSLLSSGLQVGSGVVIDSTGLKIGGVLQPAIGVSTASSDDNSSDTLTTTPKNLTTITFTLPAWADTVHFVVHNRAQLSTGANARTLRVGLTVNDPSAPSGFHVTSVPAASVGECTRFVAQSVGATAVIRGWYSLGSGTESSHNEQLRGLAWFTRS